MNFVVVCLVTEKMEERNEKWKFCSCIGVLGFFLVNFVVVCLDTEKMETREYGSFVLVLVFWVFYCRGLNQLGTSV